MRVFPIVLTLAVTGFLGACAPQIPDSGGTGFDNSEDAQRARDLALTGAGGRFVPPVAISDEPLSATTNNGFEPVPPVATAGSSSSANSADIAAETAAALQATSPNASAAPVAGATAQPPVSTPQIGLDNPGISDENDFSAVSAERTIQSDAARTEALRENYQVIEPTALPSRSGSADPNIVNYALQTSHPRGTRLYSRSGINLAARAQRACAGFASPDQAQIEFLASGGPERDRRGLDPDGDGYACAWNPAPFRAAVQN